MSYIGKFMSGRYKECLNYPLMILAVLLVMVAVAIVYVGEFKFDASEDTLVAEGDPELAYYREVSQSFGGDEFLIMTYTPESGDLITPANLQHIEVLTDRLLALEGVRGVTSILDVPLLESPPMPLSEMAENIVTLRSPDANLDMAARELTQSPLFSELLISVDGDSTAIRIDLKPFPEVAELRSNRNRLRRMVDPSNEDQRRLASVEQEFDTAYEHSLNQRDATLEQIRGIRDSLGDDVTAYLGGVPLVASDMIAYVKSDIVKFGSAVVLLVAIMLFLIFRRMRWVVVPLLTTAVSVLMTVGLLGFMGQATTVISSNFISLLAIITISFTIHLIARYRELRALTPDARHTDLVKDAMVDKFPPCAYTAITTMVAFGSLTTSEIVPVMDFGWIMCAGILISFVVTYSLFAAILLLLPKGKPASTLHSEPVFTRLLSYISSRHTVPVLIAAALSFLIAGIGASQVSLDNRFIEYFRSDTEIHKGMAYIDEHLGGTIPLDVILSFPPYADQADDAGDDFFTETEDAYPERYWFTSDKIRHVRQVHEYLESRPEIGKVISLSTMERIARTFNDGEALGGLEMAYALGQIPEEFRQDLIDPYASPQSGLMRISARIHETHANFTYDQLIEDIRTFAREELDMPPETTRVTGMAVLFNGMLEHLFDSQRSTILFVVGFTGLMFLVLLRSLMLAVLGLVPNVLAAVTILAFMGFVGIPLDIMTITIAAIIIGIGVDDAIHYLHRFKSEFVETGDVKAAVRNSHNSIGDALYYTTFTVVIGFSVLAFSSFVPTIYFGVLTALAMVLALLANLTVLPALLIMVYRRRRSVAT